MGLWVLMPSLLHGGTILSLDFPSTGQKKKKKKGRGCWLKKTVLLFLGEKERKPWRCLLALVHQHIAVMESHKWLITCDNHWKVKGTWMRREWFTEKVSFQESSVGMRQTYSAPTMVAEP